MLRRFVLWLVFIPVQLLIAALLFLAELVRFTTRAPRISRRYDPGALVVKEPTLCSIVILNWNGRHLLEETLPALQKAVRYSGEQHEIIVVDNGSQDDSVSWIRENWPYIRIVALDSNRGFGEGNNRGVEAARHEIVLLLNNDMIVCEDFLPPLLQSFSDPQVFAVSSQILFPEEKRREETGNTQARLERGYLHLSHEPLQWSHYTRKYLPVLWAGGGSSAFHRTRFLELGGFSNLFAPCYLEDTDLSYRAWRRGWKILLAAQSKVLHKHRSSSSVRFQEQQLHELVEERRLWYLWRNYQLRTLLSHFLFFPIHLIKCISVTGYLRALRKLPAILYLRALEPQRALSDKQLFEWTRRPLRYLNDVGAPLPDGRGSVSSHGSVDASKKPLKILIVSAYLPHLGRHGGAGRVFQFLHRVSKKHEVSLITFVENEEELRELEQVRPHSKRVEAVLRRGFSPVSLFPYEPFEEFNSPEFGAKLEQVLAEENFDVVHFEWTQMAQYADLAPRSRKMLTEIEVNYAAHRSLVPLEPQPLRKLRKYYNSLQTFYRELELCRKVDAVVCVTETDREYLRGYLPAEKLFVINTGVDTEFFNPNGFQQPDSNAIVFVGAFRHGPNVDAMLYFCSEVFPLVLQDQPQAHLYVVGSSPPPCIQGLDSHPSVTVTGFVEDVRDYYRKAQVVIVPLRTGVGIRGKILEGWAEQKAMVATTLACQGIRALHGENILIADRKDEFALWTVALLRNPDFGKRLGQAGRATAVQYYDWSLLGEHMIELYERLVKTK